MQTIGLIDPSPTARANLAAGLRGEFTVVEGDALSPAIADGTTSLIVAAAEAIPPDALSKPPFAALPFLILGPWTSVRLGSRTSVTSTPASRMAPVRVLNRPVDNGEVLRQARALLRETNGVRLMAGQSGGLFGPPFVSGVLADVVGRAARAHRAQLPVLLVGEPGTGKRSAARALHRVANYGTLLRLTPQTASEFADGRLPALQSASTEPVTLVADGIEAFSGQAEAALVECLVDGTLRAAGAHRPFWLLATASADLRSLADAGHFDPALASRLGEMVIELPPLRTRRQDIGAIATEILGKLGEELGASLSITSEALCALERHAWPGNLAELTGVLRRTVVMSLEDVIGPDELLFEPRIMTVGMPPPIPPARQGLEKVRDAIFGEDSSPREPIQDDGVTRPPSDALRVELILAELAHELKNPMVTIKTFAQQLPALMDDADSWQQFAAFTDDAISRMDGLLENVLDFARFGAPDASPVSLSAVLDRALASVGEQIEARSARVRREAWANAPGVLGDERQLTYAFRNLFESLVAELPMHHEFSVSLGDDGTTAIRFVGAGGVTAKLQSFLRDAADVLAPSVLPLRFVLARAVIVQNETNIVLATGYNGLPRKVRDLKTRYGKDKLSWICHAETNAIFNAARAGVCIEDSCIYVTKTPCVICAGAILATAHGSSPWRG